MNSKHQTNPQDGQRVAGITPEGVADSAQWFGDHDVIEIHHSGEVYRLRRTRSGKLILNK